MGSVVARNATAGGSIWHRPKRPISAHPKPRAIRRGFATSVEIWIWDRDLGLCRSEAGLLDDLDSFGSAWDAELVVDRRDVRLDGGACEVEAMGDLLEREMCRQESDEPELGRCEPVVLSCPVLIRPSRRCRRAGSVPASGYPCSASPATCAHSREPARSHNCYAHPRPLSHHNTNPSSSASAGQTYTSEDVAERATSMTLRNRGEPSGFAPVTTPVTPSSDARDQPG